jgi:hypothetical protein
MAVLAGLVMQAEARAQCPELDRLRSAIVEAQKRLAIAPGWERCGSYGRLSVVEQARAEYARQNVEACGISDPSLAQMEREYRNAEQARANVCAGRPARPFPPEIIER